ncbi:uncharacterized protein LOC113510438 [Galleria mellonella]|uniref:Uncharacterized protein LOC113510438 n=1 Tax=Galleria mellonella TaxID=7137 RepID=A0ABM3N4Y7_GALME|nr:uncharacterized protein LOC113510438 [Galleria mellonella]XP_052758641.1 uncharacterized protein LOC113510438 [Galleria mellonella]
MFQQGRVIIIWLSWFIGGISGVVILLIIICYCRLMPRHQKSFDEQYLKENYAVKENHAYTSQENYRIKHAESGGGRAVRPASYAGGAGSGAGGGAGGGAAAERRAHCYVNRVPEPRPSPAQYSSSTVLDEIEGAANMDALKTRSLPAFLRPKPRPLSTEDDLHQLYAKVNLSKKYKNRMRSEHAAIIALSKSHSQFFDADAVIVYDQRTAL